MSGENGNHFNKGFKLFLIKQGIKQQDVADATGWPESKVSLLANGRREPTQKDIEALAHIFSMSVKAFKKQCGW